MAKRDVPSHILIGSVDLDARKTLSERQAEEKRVAEYPRQESLVRSRATQKASLRHIYEIAKYLGQRGMILYVINCGYHRVQKEWQVLIMFGKEGCTDEARNYVRQEILSQFIDSKPAMDLAIKRTGEFPKRLLAPWMSAEQWVHMTKLGAWEGQPYVYMKDGENDAAEFLDYGRAVSEVIQFGTIIKYFFKMAPKRRDYRLDLTLDGALRKMKEASLDELFERNRILLDRLINGAPGARGGYQDD